MCSAGMVIVSSCSGTDTVYWLCWCTARLHVVFVQVMALCAILSIFVKQLSSFVVSLYLTTQLLGVTAALCCVYYVSPYQWCSQDFWFDRVLV